MNERWERSERRLRERMRTREEEDDKLACFFCRWEETGEPGGVKRLIYVMTCNSSGRWILFITHTTAKKKKYKISFSLYLSQ